MSVCDKFWSVNRPALAYLPNVYTPYPWLCLNILCYMVVKHGCVHTELNNIRDGSMKRSVLTKSAASNRFTIRILAIPLGLQVRAMTSFMIVQIFAWGTKGEFVQILL
jgi:hypothetical protein